ALAIHVDGDAANDGVDDGEKIADVGIDGALRHHGRLHFHHISGASCPCLPAGAGSAVSFRIRQMAVSDHLGEHEYLSCGVTASHLPNAGTSERHRPRGRGESGCLWCVDGPDCPTQTVKRPPDAHRVGEVWAPASTGSDTTP